MSATGALVRLELRDQVRDRKAMLARLGPTLFVVLGMAFSVIITGGQDALDIDLGRLAVSGDVSGADRLLAELVEAGFDIDEVTDAAAEVAGADTPVGLVLSGSSDASLAAGVPVDATIVARSDGEAQKAVLALRAALVDVDAAHNPLPTRLGVTVETVDASTAETRSDLARLVPGLLVLLGTAATANVAGQLADKRRDGVLAAQLSLPIERRSLVMGKVGAEVVLTMAAIGLPLVLCALGLAAVVGLDGDAGWAIGTAVLAVVTGLAAAVAFGLVGVTVALRWPAHALGSSITMFPMLVGVAALLVNAAIEADVPAALAGVPVLGLVLATRAAAMGALGAGFLFAALAATVLAGAGAVRTIARFDLDALAVRS